MWRYPRFMDPRDQVMQAIPLANGGGVEGDHEFKAAGACETGGVAVRLVMLLQDQCFEALSREGRGTAQSAETRADDHRIELAFACSAASG
jgi:hypothetical protein